jgi:hypothetical protein
LAFSFKFLFLFWTTWTLCIIDTRLPSFFCFASFRFSKGQKRASVLLSDVSQSILSALAPTSPQVPPTSATATASPIRSLIDESDDAGNIALGRALLPDTVVLSRQPLPSQTAPTPTPETNDDDDWNW